MITQEELNSRIVESSEKILLIFKNYKQLNLYRRNFGKDYRKILLTMYDVEHRGLTGLRYNNWHYVDEIELDNMIKNILKDSDVKYE